MVSKFLFKMGQLGFLLSTLVLFGCKNENQKELQVSQIKDAWDILTKDAVNSCQDSLSVRHANKTFTLIDKYHLRNRILTQLSHLITLESVLYLVEEYGGDDPKTYSVYFKKGSDRIIYVFTFQRGVNNICIQVFDSSDKEYQWYYKYFDAWGDYKDYVTKEQEIFLCGDKSLRQETLFRVKIDV